MNSQITGKIQMFQRRPGKLRIAPVPMHLSRHVQVGGADRSPLRNDPFHLLTHRLDIGMAPFPLPVLVAVAFKIGPVLRGKDGEVFIEVINQHPVLVQKLIKHLLRKSLYPGQQDQLRTPSAYVYRIELYTALLFYKLQDSPFSFKPVSTQKAMSPQQKTPRLLPG